jgi:ribosome maturation factor RimP
VIESSLENSGFAEKWVLTHFFYCKKRKTVRHEQAISRIWQEFDPFLSEAGYELVEVEYASGGSRILRFFIDKAGGDVTLDDCASVSRLIGARLDELDLIPDRYTLEVSSPGIDRPVRKASDFERFTGEELRVVLHAPVSGRRKFRGILRGFQDGLVQLESGGEALDVHVENIKKANLNR